MKKSKVIIPAMALLLFSTAASITGTVAWFSSTRSFQLNASTFAVKEVEGGLAAAVLKGVGTEAQTTTGGTPSATTYLRPSGDTSSTDFPTDAKKIVTQSKHDLTHGSFDASGKHAYIVNRDSTGAADFYSDKGIVGDKSTNDSAEKTFLDSPHTSSDKWFVTKADESSDDTPDIHYYYVAFSWTIRFYYAFNSEANDVGVYFNLKDSSISHHDSTKKDNESGLLTIKGFRIAFIPITTDVIGPHSFVWGKNSDISDDTRLKYVKGESSESGVGTYNGDNPIKYYNTNADYTKAADATNSATNTTNKTKDGRLFTLYKSGNNYCDVKCVAWYEGEDSNIKSGARMDEVDVSMSFYARSDYAIDGTVISA